MNKNIYDVVQVYDETYDTFCYQNCLKHVLEFYGVDEADLYINKSISLCMHKYDDFTSPFFYDKDARTVIPEFSQKVTRITPQDKNCVDVFLENLDMVKSGRPIIVGVDSYYLPYLPYFKKSHGRHTVIFSGYDEKKREVQVVDWMNPWLYKGSVSLNDFLNARDSSNPYDGGIFSGSPILNNWAVVDDKGWDKSRHELIMNIISLSLKQYFCPSIRQGEMLYGLEALKQIGNFLAILEEGMPEEEQKKCLVKLHRNLYGLNRRRIFLKGFVEKGACVWGYDMLSYFLEPWLKVIDEWERWMYKTIKYSMRIRKGYTEDLLSKMATLLLMEHDAGRVLMDIYNDFRLR